MGSSSCGCETGASFIKQLWVAREGGKIKKEREGGKGRGIIREGRGRHNC